MTLTNDEHVALLKAALAARDRQWEDCLRTLDEKPPLVPDPEWFRTWSERVGLQAREATELELDESATLATENTIEIVRDTFRDAHTNGKRAWTHKEIDAALKELLDGHNAQE